jgi:hypothetical protein
MTIDTRWNRLDWRWRALATGFALVLVTVLVALLASLVIGERTSAFLTIGLLAELFILSLIGSGMLAGTSRRMSLGGLQRETATIDTDFKPPDESGAGKERDRQLRDRRTIRVGIMALPVFLAFIYMLFR